VVALCLIVDICTDGRTDGWTFLPSLLGHLGGDDLKREPRMSKCSLIKAGHSPSKCTLLAFKTGYSSKVNVTSPENILRRDKTITKADIPKFQKHIDCWRATGVLSAVWCHP